MNLPNFALLGIYELCETTQAMIPVDHSSLFASYDAIQTEKIKQSLVKNTPRNALQAYLHKASEAKTGSGFQRMQRCRYG